MQLKTPLEESKPVSKVSKRQEFLAKLDSLPKKAAAQPQSITAFLVSIGDKLEETQKKGYTIKDILRLLADYDIKTSEGTLRLALSRYRKLKREEERKRARELSDASRRK